MRKKIISILLAGTLLLGVAGCANTGDESGEDKEVVLTGEMVPVASFNEVNLAMSEFSDYAWVGDTFIYLKNEWWSEDEMLKSTLCRVSATGNEEPEVLYENQVGEPSLIRFTIDDDGNMYWLERFYHDGNENHYQVRKVDENLQEQYCYTLDENAFELENFLAYVNDVYVDCDGNLVITDVNNQVYFLDAEGKFMGKDVLGLSTIDNFVNARE